MTQNEPSSERHLKLINHQTKLVKNLISSNGLRIKNIISEKNKRKIVVQRCEIWTCDFGQNVGAEINGVRPCIIIQKIKNLSPITIVIPIHKYLLAKEKYVNLIQEDIHILHENYLEGFACISQIRSISKSRLGRKIANLSPSGIQKIELAIMDELIG